MATTTDKGTIALEITSGLHAADLLAAEKLEAYLNEVGLDTAAQRLGLTEGLSAAGPNQLSIPFRHAA